MPLKLLTSPGSRWPGVLAGNRQSEIWSAFLELTRCEQLERDEFYAGQEEQLIELLKHCQDHVPYYRERWSAGMARGLDDLTHYPILSRRELAENFQQLSAQRLPAGHVALGIRHSSGSTGEPVQVRQTSATQLWHYAFYLRSLEWGRFDPTKTFAAIRYYEPKLARELQKGLQTPSLDPALSGFLKMSPSYVMDVHVDVRAQFEWLSKIQPDYIVSYPSNLVALGRLNRSTGELKPDRILSLSEELTEFDESMIVTDFACRVHNVYSCHEAGILALPCPASSSDLHVCEDNVVLEIVDEVGRPCPVGVEGRVLVTTLHNFGTPLVRYDIGDRAAWSARECGCGRPHRLIQRPSGKRQPLFTLPNGNRKNSMALAAGMRRIGGQRQFRVTQKNPRQILVEGVAVSSFCDYRSDASEGRKEETRRMIEEFLESTEIQVLFAAYDSRLPLRAGGKSPHLVTEIPEPAD